MRAHPSPPAAVVIPVFNEEESIGLVLEHLDRTICDPIVVVDNGSTDATARVARECGAVVVREEHRGYGAACLAGIAWVEQNTEADVILFIDGDYSDHPEQAAEILSPIFSGAADLVIGSRSLGTREPGAMPPQAIFGNWLSTILIRLIWGVRFTDLGPFRAIRGDLLTEISMQDRTYGWTVEMQAKAARLGARVVEVPADYRRRIGQSKISGTISGSVRAGVKILYTIGAIAFARSRPGNKLTRSGGR